MIIFYVNYLEMYIIDIEPTRTGMHSSKLKGLIRAYNNYQYILILLVHFLSFSPMCLQLVPSKRGRVGKSQSWSLEFMGKPMLDCNYISYMYIHILILYLYVFICTSFTHTTERAMSNVTKSSCICMYSARYGSSKGREIERT